MKLLFFFSVCVACILSCASVSRKEILHVNLTDSSKFVLLPTEGIEQKMDMKISFFYTSKSGKVRFEAYNALENILSLLYTSQGNTYFNPYTGEVAKGRTSASYSLPFPIPSFGFKFSY